MDLEKMKADFLAKGGQVKSVPVGATNGMRSKDWKAAVRGETLPQAMSSEQFAEQRAEQIREAYHVGGRQAVDEVLRRA